MIYPVTLSNIAVRPAACELWYAWHKRCSGGQSPDFEANPWLPIGVVGCVLILAHCNPDAPSIIPLNAHQRVVIHEDQYASLLIWLQQRIDTHGRNLGIYVEPKKTEHPSEWMTTREKFAAFLEDYYLLSEGQRKSLGIFLKSGTLAELSEGLKESLDFLSRDRTLCDAHSVAALSASGNLIPDHLRTHNVYAIASDERHYFCISANVPHAAFSSSFVPLLKEKFPEKELILVLAPAESIAVFQRKGISGTHQQRVFASSAKVVAGKDDERVLRIKGELARVYTPDRAGITPEQLWSWVFHEAIQRRATDIRFEMQNGNGRISVKVDRVMQLLTSIPLNTYGSIVTFIRTRAGLSDTILLPQDGNMTVAYQREGSGTEHYNLRLNFVRLRMTNHQVLAVRILTKSGGASDMRSLGLNAEEIAVIEDALNDRQGMILSTGPTGSGKSTLLYAGVEYLLHRRPEVVFTIEDPIEKIIEGATQTEVNTRGGDVRNHVTQGILLDSALRQNPDTILIGEIRNEVSCQTGIRAAATGHRVLSTLHTTSAADSIFRLIDLAQDPNSLRATITNYVVATVSLIIGQRLIRRSCHCAVPCAPNGEQRAYFQLAGMEAPKEVLVAKGCIQCHNTGYLGIMGIVEFLPLRRHPDLGEAIMRGVASHELRKMLDKLGYKSLLCSALHRVSNMETTFEEAVINAATAEDRFNVMNLLKKEGV